MAKIAAACPNIGCRRKIAFTLSEIEVFSFGHSTARILMSKSACFVQPITVSVIFKVGQSETGCGEAFVARLVQRARFFFQHLPCGKEFSEHKKAYRIVRRQACVENVRIKNPV